jgi:hypothetical protein
MSAELDIVVNTEILDRYLGSSYSRVGVKV